MSVTGIELHRGQYGNEKLDGTSLESSVLGVNWHELHRGQYGNEKLDGSSLESSVLGVNSLVPRLPRSGTRN